MIRLDGSRIDYNRTQDNGEDLRFVDADLRRILPHEIEVWNESGDSVVWVAVPRIPASSTDHIWIYYGNPSAPDGQNPEGVWDQRFQGVWHLAETGGSSTAYDSTINQNHGTYQNGCVLGQSGEQGDLAVSFDGDDDYVDLGGLDIVGASGNNGITMEVYAWPNTATNEERLMSKSDGSAQGDHWWMLSLSNGNRLRFRLKLNGNTQTLVASSGNVTVREWFYGVAAYAGNGMQLYFKGQSAGGNTRTGAISTDGGKIARIASNHSEYLVWDGLISEVRVSNIGRTQAWIRAQNLSLTDSFVTFGLEESR
jgi:biopolymer transport protein ExbB